MKKLIISISFFFILVLVTVAVSATEEAFSSNKFGEMTKNDPVAAIEWAARSGISWDAFTVVLKEQGVPEDRVGDMKKIFDAAKPKPVSPVAPVKVDPVVAPTGLSLREELRLQFGVAEKVVVPNSQLPNIVWAEGNAGEIRVPVFHRPEGVWSILTGDMIGGVKTPPTIVTPESGRKWTLIDKQESAIPVTAPDGTLIPLDGAVRDGAIVYGTVK